MIDQTSRTSICSVVFLDIVGYSKQTVDKQMSIKNDFNKLISGAIRNVPVPERVILDTGDGAALCFLADPEIALVVSIWLCDALRERERNGDKELLVRIGINLGSVKVVTDLNGQPNIIGDGINVGQRVMSFARPNQILASRSFYEVVSCLTHEYSRLFAYYGMHKDKHVREHEIYEVLLNPEPKSDEHDPAPVPEPEPAVAEPQSSAAQWEAGTLEAIESLFATYLGPMAKVLVRKTAKSTSNVSELAEALSQSLAVESQRTCFLEKAGKLIPYCPVPPRCSIDDAPHKKNGLTVEKTVEPSGPKIASDTLRAAELDLASYIGPLAKVLVARAAKTASSGQELYRILSAEITNDAERKKFMAGAERLGR